MAIKKGIELKHIVRSIGVVTMPNEQVYSAVDVETYINSYLNNGYELYATHYLGVGAVAGSYNMMYVLLKVSDF